MLSNKLFLALEDHDPCGRMSATTPAYTAAAHFPNSLTVVKVRLIMIRYKLTANATRDLSPNLACESSLQYPDFVSPS